MASGTEIAHDVLKTIRQIVRRISQHSKSLSQECGLTVPQLMCLKAIGELEVETKEVTVVMVSTNLQLSPATVSRIIDRLVRSGLILRERRAKDRRKVCLSLTSAGLERYQTLPTPLQERFVRRLMALPEEERVQLLDTLRRVSTLMGAENLDAAPILAPGTYVRPGPNSVT